MSQTLSIPDSLRSSNERIIWASLWPRGPRGRRGLPLCLVGDPGTTKTSKVEHICRLAGFVGFDSLIASLRQPHDFLGMPVMSQVDELGVERMKLDKAMKHYATAYAPPYWAMKALMTRWSALLLDEVTTCPPSVQAALLRIVFEGVVGELQLPAEMRFILAMNKPEDAAGGWDISLPLANRLGFLDWSGPDVDEFTSYMSGSRDSVTPLVVPQDMEDEVDAAWPLAWARAVGLVAGFLKAKPDALHIKPRDSAQGYSWPSVRTWDMATIALATSKLFGLTAAETSTFMGAFVGAAVVTEFDKWCLAGDLPDPRDLLEGRAQFQHEPRRLDRTVAVMSAVTALAMRLGPKDPWLLGVRPRLWEILASLPDNSLDLVVRPTKMLFEGKLAFGEPKATALLGRMDQMLRALGMNLPDEAA